MNPKIRVINAFSALSYEDFMAFDKAEPEFKALKSVYDKGVNERLLSIIGVAAALIDYMLPKGGARLFWSDLCRIAMAIEIKSLSDVEKLFNIFLTTRTTRRLNLQKMKRAQIFFNKVAGKILNNFESYRKNPNTLWDELTLCFNTKPWRKTIAFAMKVFDIVSLVCRNRYLKFSEMWIPVDFHIRELTIIFKLADESAKNKAIIETWREISSRVERIAQNGINLFRIDSVLWQIGNLMYEREKGGHVWNKEKVLGYMLRIGVNENHAVKFVEEIDKIQQ